MERRRLVVVLAGLVLIGGAVAALRLANGTPDVHATPPPPPLPTVITRFTAEGVLAPSPGDRPAPPRGLVVVPGPRRLEVAWGKAPGAVGYEVRWGAPGALDHVLLVAEPTVELPGLSPRTDVSVQVESVDAFGQRSVPAGWSGQPLPDDAAGPDNALLDRFDGTQVPDPRLWRMADVNDCAQAVHEQHRLVLLSECGQSSVTLRARAPFRLNRVPSGELGRFTIDTDAPGEGGELDIDLVPGAVDMVDGSPNDPIATAPADVAVPDANLPPGTIRVRIAAAVDSDTDLPSDTVQVAAGPGVPTVPTSRTMPFVLPRPATGVSARWDVVLRTDGVQVLRDGVYVGGGNVVPAWSAATALVEFAGTGLGQQRDDVNMIGFGGAPTGPPPAAASPALTLTNFVAPVTSSPAADRQGTDTGPGSGLLMMTVLAKPNAPGAPVLVDGAPPVFTVLTGDGAAFPATPAVPGTALLPEVRYPLVARIPAAQLDGVRDLPVRLAAQVPAKYPAMLELEQAAVDVTPGPRTGPPRVQAGPGITEIPPQLAVPRVQVLDASGDPVAGGTPLPHGRIVLDITMDAVAGERQTGELAGLAGFKVWVDDAELAALPTATDGPGIAGEWRIAFGTGGQAAGPHTVDVRAFGAQRGVPFAETFTSYQLAS